MKKKINIQTKKILEYEIPNVELSSYRVIIKIEDVKERSNKRRIFHGEMKTSTRNTASDCPVRYYNTASVVHCVSVNYETSGANSKNGKRNSPLQF